MRMRPNRSPSRLSGGYVGRQLHLQQHDRVLDLKLALFQAAQLQRLDVAFLGHAPDHLIEPTMLELQFGDPKLEGIGTAR